MEAIDFVEYDTTFLNLSWDWLNDPEIKFLTDTPDFSRDQQLSWFEGLKNRSDYKVWGIRIGAERIGVCGLKNITNSSAEYFGYIADKSFWAKDLVNFCSSLLVKRQLKWG